MRIRLSRRRCGWALLIEDDVIHLATRCMMQPGHNGGHEAKGLKKFASQRIKWFAGDHREFKTDKGDEWAWTVRA